MPVAETQTERLYSVQQLLLQQQLQLLLLLAVLLLLLLAVLQLLAAAGCCCCCVLQLLAAVRLRRCCCCWACCCCCCWPAAAAAAAAAAPAAAHRHRHQHRRDQRRHRHRQGVSKPAAAGPARSQREGGLGESRVAHVPSDAGSAPRSVARFGPAPSSAALGGALKSSHPPPQPRASAAPAWLSSKLHANYLALLVRN